MNKVSILMPVYNVKKYLKQSMESILDQTYSDYEVICIDDGSTDGSEIMLDEYAGKYNNVKVIHKANSGYGSSMNIGTEMAEGEYIGILEPDDYVEKNWLFEVMQAFEQNDGLDFVKCDYYDYDNNINKWVKLFGDSKMYNRVLENNEVFSLFYAGHIAHWSAVYRKSFLTENRIKYNETPGASFQDLGMWFLTIVNAKKIMLLDKAFYHYRCDNPDSSMKNPSKVDCTRYECDFIWSHIKDRSDIDKLIPYYTRCRVASTIDTYKRIEEAYRKDYLYRVHDDFCELMLNPCKLNDEDKPVFEALSGDVCKLWEKKSEKISLFHRRIAAYSRICIYGAGNIARFIYRMLDDKERKKLEAFVVSSLKQEEKLGDIPVREFTKEGDTDILYIIGVSARYCGEVMDNLANAGITNIFSFEDRLNE